MNARQVAASPIALETGGWVGVVEVPQSLDLEVRAGPLRTRSATTSCRRRTTQCGSHPGLGWGERQAETFAFHLLVDLEEARAEGLTDTAAIVAQEGCRLEFYLCN